jgi:hypothetical protein
VTRHSQPTVVAGALANARCDGYDFLTGTRDFRAPVCKKRGGVLFDSLAVPFAGKSVMLSAFAFGRGVAEALAE